jgi:hypothetical protein
MTWIKLDDKLPNNPKILPLSDKAFRLYIEGMCYANQYLTDGFLADAVIKRLDAGNVASELIEAGLWDECNGGINIHDYMKHQTSKDEIESKQEKARTRVQRYREKVGNADVTPNETRYIQENNADVTEPETETETETEITTAPIVEPQKKTPNGVQRLVTLYFDSFVGEIKPPGKQIAGQIMICLKQLSPERLAEIIPLVAAEGKPITVGTVAYHANQKKPEIVATPTPPRFTAESAQNGNAVPMPEYLKSSLKGVLRGV